ncbi:fucose mutarotase-like isoform X2 [Antedon mediterranea]|uniref:fucose mutarotase-like isoform X2 n=1 Tax=Antedon mediterranea TaxID=105859 RepID=UPI003AF8EACD
MQTFLQVQYANQDQSLYVQTVRGNDIPGLLKAILTLLPLDTYVDQPAVVMQLVDSDAQRQLKTPVWEIYKEMLTEAEGRQIELRKVERFKFYDRARTAFAVVATGEKALYGNLILKKGVISSSQ